MDRVVNFVTNFLSKTSLGMERSAHKFLEVCFEAAHVKLLY